MKRVTVALLGLLLFASYANADPVTLQVTSGTLSRDARTGDSWSWTLYGDGFSETGTATAGCGNGSPLAGPIYTCGPQLFFFLDKESAIVNGVPLPSFIHEADVDIAAAPLFPSGAATEQTLTEQVGLSGGMSICVIKECSPFGIGSYIFSLDGLSALLTIDIVQNGSFPGGWTTQTESITIEQPTPEPSTVALFFIGATGLWFFYRSRKLESTFSS